MRPNKLTEKEKEIIKSFKITNNNSALVVAYKITNINPSTKKLRTITRTLQINIDTSPTNNCQMASIRGFYALCSTFYSNKVPKHKYKYYNEYGKYYKLKENYGNIMRENARITRLACLTGFAQIHKKITAKRLFFIDIPKNYVKMYYELHPYLFKKRTAEREVHYISTNKSNMMYSVIEIDKSKLENYI